MSERSYIIFCDESEIAGKFYSNFYGGVIVGSSQYDRISSRLNAEKRRLNLFGEVKWAKVSEHYLGKYQELIRAFFAEVHAEKVRVRVMFRQNAHTATGLSQNQIEGQYFRLYYQFIKHGFGLFYHPPAGNPVALKIYFDELPETREATTQFKGYILGLKDNVEIRQAGLTLSIEDIAEIRSHDHVLAQCLDVVLGAMSFRLNDKHKAIPQGQHRRGKRTIAKEKLYKTILAEINQTKRNFNIGISTGGTLKDRWFAKYRHWRFVPSEMEYHKELTKPKAKK